MRIIIDEILDDNVIKEGVYFSIKNPKCKKIPQSFEEEYKRLLRKPVIAIIIICLSFTAAFYCLSVSGQEYPLIPAIFLNIFYIFVISLPFIINIFKIKAWYESSIILYELLQNKKNLFLDFEEYELVLKNEESILRIIKYSELICIENYKNFIVFKCQDDKKSFFISSSHRKQLLDYLQKLNLSYLVKNND